MRPENYAVWVNLGVELSSNGQRDEAVDCYKRAIELNPNLAPAYNGLGAELNHRARYDEAIACFRKAIALEPTLAELHANLGDSLKFKGRFDEAIAEFKKARELKPTLAGIAAGLGGALSQRPVRRGDRQLARSHRNRSEGRQVPQQPGAILCDVKGDYDGAIACFRKAIELDPKDAVAHMNLGNAIRGKGDLDGAIKWYKKAIEVDPKYVEAHCNLAETLKDKGQLDEAIACYKKGIELDSTNVTALHGLGAALCDGKEEYDAAIACFRKALELDPKNAECHVNMGVALGKKGQSEAAIDWFQKAIALDPNYADAQMALALPSRIRASMPSPWCPLGEATSWGRNSPIGAIPRRIGFAAPRRSAALEAKLPAYLSGQLQPRDDQERLLLAEVCGTKKFHRTAARLYADAFAADSKLADDLTAEYRFYAICNAVMASAAQSMDGAQPDDKERASFRHQSLDWLRSDLAQWTKLLESGPPESAPGHCAEDESLEARARPCLCPRRRGLGEADSGRTEGVYSAMG